jgi:hypothetical protein
MALKQVAGWLFLAFVLWFIITAPVSAAHVVHSIVASLSTAAHRLSVFLTSVTA